MKNSFRLLFFISSIRQLDIADTEFSAYLLYIALIIAFSVALGRIAEKVLSSEGL